MNDDYLFAYGTLQDSEVQRYVFHRNLEGRPDTLRGYRISEKKMYGRYLVLEATKNPGDEINGMAYGVTRPELLKADVYEGPAYKRIPVSMESGLKAWVYVEKVPEEKKA